MYSHKKHLQINYSEDSSLINATWNLPCTFDKALFDIV